MLLLLSAYFSLFGLVALGGGILGFVRAKSRASLVAGVASGALLFVAAGLAGGGNALAGAVLGGLVSVALVGRFLPAYLRTKKTMPAGLVAGLGAVGAILAAIASLR